MGVLVQRTQGGGKEGGRANVPRGKARPPSQHLERTADLEVKHESFYSPSNLSIVAEALECSLSLLWFAPKPAT